MSRAMSPEVCSDQAYPPAPNFLLLGDIMGGCLAFIEVQRFHALAKLLDDDQCNCVDIGIFRIRAA